MIPPTSVTADPLPPEARLLIRAADDLVSVEGPRVAAARVRALVGEHDRYRDRCLNLLAAESIMGPAARRLLDSGMATRVTEGFPGAKDPTTSPPEANRFVDEIEAILIALCRVLFRARHVEWRPLGTTMANAVAMSAFTEAGDTIMVQSMGSGGNVSYHDAAGAGLLKIRAVDLPGTPDFDIDIDGLSEAVRRERPKCIIFGGSKILFPYDVAAIREVADEVGALVIYDAAHVAPLIAGGRFGDPLREGAHVLITGTHKLMGGPVGGLLMTDSDEVADRLHRATYPAFIQSRDQNKYAAAAVAVAEMIEFGAAFAGQVVDNARRLAASLQGRGFDVLAAERGFTCTHQILVDASNEGAREVAARCCAAGVFVAPTNIFGDDRGRHELSGVRFSVAQVTRQGMGTDEMDVIASLAADATWEREPSDTIRARVEALVERYTNVGFAYTEAGLDTAAAARG